MKQMYRGLMAGLLVAVTAGSLAGCAGGAVVFIPDPGLEAAIRLELGKPLGFLTTGDLISLTELDARGFNINSIQGLDGAANLRFLDLSNNNISDLTPLTNLGPSLEVLDLENNDIFDINPLRGLLFLRSLNLCSNLDISSLTPLAINAANAGPNNQGLGTGDSVVVDQQLEDVDPVSITVLLDAGVEVVVCESGGGS